MSTNDQLVDSWREEFRSAHSSDRRNAAIQPFDDYWRWVRTFLITGAAGYRGWLDQIEETLGHVRDSAARDRLRRQMQALGKTIAAEWSKESRYRQIFSTFFQGAPNLQDWGRRLQRAARDDTGDGAAIERALTGIENEMNAALRK